MAPCSISPQPASTNRKMRKPVVEKMRRDRINSSIEQLRMLLEKEFEKHHLPTKPEKADILEVAVSFLQQQLVTKSADISGKSYKEGYSKCVEESLHFLSARNHHSEGNLLKHFHGHQCSSVETHQSQLLPGQSPLTNPVTNSKVLWRPW
ncbi:transcription factor HES-5 [Xenopus laevis]|uniref:Transcription factor HES-5 n=2 Tax=Xenopus laevis TaxID=8355 RepID=A0A1L8FGI2_XENLA|nr:transcription factor HES-5 [Xenopus laevis]OCT70682.1 hypothetical protein XELAEV_18037605mg [Xenopus laevis]